MGKVLKYINEKVILSIGTVLFGLSAVWMLVEALSRQLFACSFAISEEIVIFSLAWAILLTLAQAGRKGYHIAVDLFTGKMPPKIKRAVNITISCLSIGYCALILVSSLKFIPHLYAIGVISESPLQLPMWIVYMAVPVGSILLILFYFERVVCYIRNNELKDRKN